LEVAILNMKKETIILGADHAGFEVKEFIKKELLKMDYPVEDVGTYDKSIPDDYPDYAEKVAVEVRARKHG
jgi:ribose 5-phosphate isomerase B